MFAASGAALLCIVAVIVSEQVGWAVGVAAAVYLFTQTSVPDMYTGGTSMIVFFPALLWGTWLFSRQRERWGALALCFAAMIRIEAFAVLGWLCWSEQILARKWRAAASSCAVVAVSAGLTAVVYYVVQGSVARFNAGGPALGYVFSREPDAVRRTLSSLVYTFRSVYVMLVDQCVGPSLLVPALVGLWMSPLRRIYIAIVGGITLFLNVYVASGSGNTELRYFEFLLPLAAIFGSIGLATAGQVGGVKGYPYAFWTWGVVLVVALAGALARAPRLSESAQLYLLVAGVALIYRATCRSVLPQLGPVAWSLGALVLLVAKLHHGGWPRPARPAPYIADSARLMRGNVVPRESRVLADDEILTGVIVLDDSFYQSGKSLQFFNVQPDSVRAEILSRTDYVVVSRRRAGSLYLHNDPDRRGDSDPFRAAVRRAMRRGLASRVYGHKLRPLERTPYLVLKVD